eukprot:1371244-Amphidinium_carterae.3
MMVRIARHTVAALVREKRTFYVAACAKMHLPVSQWEPCAVPFHLLLREAVARREPNASSKRKHCPRRASCTPTPTTGRDDK